MDGLSFGETGGVDVTILVDNVVDMLLKSTNNVTRYTQESGEPLLAEHGLAILIHLKEPNIRILWDAGMTRYVLMENMRRIRFSPGNLDWLALSHGHPDHSGGMSELLRAFSGKRVACNWGPETDVETIHTWIENQHIPLVLHPTACRERWKVFKDGRRYGPMITPIDEWRSLGANIIMSESPFQFAPGCWTSGEIPRTSFEQAGTPDFLYYRQGFDFFRDRIEDDQAIVINVKDMGLVIVTGCAHSGILNTIQHAQTISGIEHVWAVIGGFHLGPYRIEEVEKVIDAFVDLDPGLVSPSHCTGPYAIQRFANRMPDAYTFGSVGTTFHFN
jgi:7,8-dihydropterin-6-yl-methyl-4-(beta-D-ribofuranosyl)aminobenzene 5'-phosphate synthase